MSFIEDYPLESQNVHADFPRTVPREMLCFYSNLFKRELENNPNNCVSIPEGIDSDIFFHLVEMMYSSPVVVNVFVAEKIIEAHRIIESEIPLRILLTDVGTEPVSLSHIGFATINEVDAMILKLTAWVNEMSFKREMILAHIQKLRVARNEAESAAVEPENVNHP
ncbi:uncharacterized protein LOC115621281 [Scaptodrosophila lebanonensis]|uniref:Uncharacterized protein LOC115621281 n=1 Tax=Drosophila lebanonensis TaxID=7225 RepID=A0A6J2T6J0_DROLE|nr:uncharacterized protein LOC115621281 [Scaptodrosophila lebanonensis]